MPVGFRFILNRVPKRFYRQTIFSIKGQSIGRLPFQTNGKNRRGRVKKLKEGIGNNKFVFLRSPFIFCLGPKALVQATKNKKISRILDFIIYFVGCSIPGFKFFNDRMSLIPLQLVKERLLNTHPSHFPLSSSFPFKKAPASILFFPWSCNS